MSAVAGLLTLKGVQAQTNEEWVSEYQETILVRNAKGLNAGTTLFGLMARLPNEPAETTEYKWFERDPVGRVVYSSAANANTSGESTLALSFDDGAGGSVSGILQSGVILYNTRTAELVRVAAVPASGASYTVIRGIANATTDTAGTSVAVLDNDTWIVVTLGKSEGAAPATAAFEPSSVYTNYIQTFNSTVELANAFKGSRLRTDIEGPLRERRIQALERISRDIELAYFLGAKSKLYASNTGEYGNIYLTGGMKAAIDGASLTDNALNGNTSSGCTIADFNDWLQSFMTVGSDAKLFLAGPKAYAALSYFANTANAGFRIMNQESVWGMAITSINTPFGEIDLAMHPLFKEIPSLNDWGFVVDLALLKQKVMEPLFLEPNIQTPGQDSYKEQFRAKYGLKMKFPGAFGYTYGLQSLKVS